MKKSRKLLTVLLAFCMVVVMMPSMAFAAEAKSGDIVILYTNDVHCGVDDNIGYAGLAAYKADKLKETDNVLLVDAGDAVQGDSVGSLTHGEYIIDIMNEVGYDVAVPGNHEFDYGMDQFLKLVEKSKASYVCSNFIDTRNGKTVLDPYVIKEVGGKKVAFVGIGTPESITKSTPVYFQDGKGNYIYDFSSGNKGKDLYAAVQKAVDAAREKGADYVIAVGHMGIDEQSYPWRSTDVIANTNGIDAFIDGHSHSTIDNVMVKNKDGKAIPHSQTGTKLAAIGELIITADGQVSTSLVTGYEKKDAAIAKYLEEIESKLSVILEKVVGKTDVDLTILGADGKRAVRNAETNMGDFCADAYKTIGKADIGIIQGGAVRDDIKAGIIKYEDVLRLHPFGSNLCVVEATGQQILDALEMGARTTPSENGGFFQVSGLTYEIDTTVDSTVETNDKTEFVKVKGARRVVNVKVDGKAIDPSKTYTVASTDYTLKEDGDGMTMFHGCKEVVPPTKLDVDMIIEYIDSLGGTVGQEYAKAQGRIKVITAEAKEDVKAYKAAAARTTKITSAKASKTKKITVKISGNSKAYGFSYSVYNAKGKKVSGLSKVGKTYTTKKLSKGTYTVKVRPYSYVVGEKVYGKTVTKKVTVK